MYQINRINYSRHLNELVVAIPHGLEDDPLHEYLISQNIKVYRGSLNNVLSRFKEVISESEAEVIIRSTADCPLFMSEILDRMLVVFDDANVDYLSNAITPTFPDGLDIEIFSREAFVHLTKSELTPRQKEHVTLGFYDGTHNFITRNFHNIEDLSSERWTVDYLEDFEFVSKIFMKTNPQIDFEGVLDFLKENKTIRNSKPSSYRNIALMKEPQVE